MKLNEVRQKTIETSKGRFVVVNVPIDVVFISQEGFVRFEDDIEYTPLISEKAQRAYKLSEITENEASSIVDLFQLQYNKYKKIYQLYNLENINQKLNHTFSAIESLHSLLESQGIEITNNTYIFKV